jgi:hypothetical protein
MQSLKRFLCTFSKIKLPDVVETKLPSLLKRKSLTNKNIGDANKISIKLTVLLQRKKRHVFEAKCDSINQIKTGWRFTQTEFIMQTRVPLSADPRN